MQLIIGSQYNYCSIRFMVSMLAVSVILFGRASERSPEFIQQRGIMLPPEKKRRKMYEQHDGRINLEFCDRGT